MYIKKLEYFQDKYKEEDLISAISTKVTAHMPVGSPCLVSLSSASYKNSKSTKAQNKIYVELQKLINMGDIEAVNERLTKILEIINVLFLFSMNGSDNDYLVAQFNSSKVCCIKKKPLIYDAYSSISIEADQIVYDESQDSEFIPRVIAQLKEVRFINYTFNNVCLSNIKSMIYNIKNIIDSLDAIYPNSTSFYQSPWAGYRVLFDTVSISFYKLADVVPIFNHKKSEGLSMEIMLTNSEINKSKLVESEISMVFRFIFTKYKENVFSIDGKPIERPHDCSIPTTTKRLYSILKEYAPNDIVKKVKKATKNGGNEACVEL